MNKNIKRLVAILCTLFLLLLIDAKLVDAEDDVLTTPIIVPIIGELHPYSQIILSENSESTWISFSAGGHFLDVCGSSNTPYALDEWRYQGDVICVVFPSTIVVDGVTLHLHRNGSPTLGPVEITHGANNVQFYKQSDWVGTWSGTVWFAEKANLSNLAALVDVYVERWYPNGLRSEHSNERMTNLAFDYRGEKRVSTDYAPIVGGIMPIPPTSTTGNCTGTIPGLIATRSVNLGSGVDDRPRYTITGGYTGNTLSYVSGISTTITNMYTASRNISGASAITTGSTYTGIGSGDVAWSVRDYQADTTSFTERIIVTTEGSPDVYIFFPGTNIEYKQEWMSKDASADNIRRNGLDIQASSTFNGKYDLASFVNGSKEQFDTVTKSGGMAVTNTRITNWQNPNTDTTGIPVTSQAFLEGDHDTALAGIGGPKYMRYDNDKPTISSVTPNADWTAIASTNATDALSGLETGSGGVFYKIVAKDAIAETTTPTDGSDWTSMNSYAKPSASGDYDIYVYAKDNATNRSPAVKVGTFTVPPKTALIRVKKTVKNNAGNANDIFLINMKEGTTLISSVPLKIDETSAILELDMGSVTSKSIVISEIIPMDYDGTKVTITVTNEAGSIATVSGDTVTIHPGDDVTIVVENTFAPTGYFKGKDFVRNLFKS